MCFASPPGAVSIFDPFADPKAMLAKYGRQDPSKVRVVGQEKDPATEAKVEAFNLLKNTPDLTAKMVRQAGIDAARNTGNARRNRASSFLSGPTGIGNREGSLLGTPQPLTPLPPLPSIIPPPPKPPTLASLHEPVDDKFRRAFARRRNAL